MEKDTNHGLNEDDVLEIKEQEYSTFLKAMDAHFSKEPHNFGGGGGF